MAQYIGGWSHRASLCAQCSPNRVPTFNYNPSLMALPYKRFRNNLLFKAPFSLPAFHLWCLIRIPFQMRPYDSLAESSPNRSKRSCLNRETGKPMARRAHCNFGATRERRDVSIYLCQFLYGEAYKIAVWEFFISNSPVKRDTRQNKALGLKERPFLILLVLDLRRQQLLITSS
jgi:hypothetical protein